MSASKDEPRDDPSEAPESGTVRDDTSGNQPAHPQERPIPMPQQRREDRKEEDEKDNGDDPSVAGEER